MKLNNCINTWTKINLKDYILTIESGKRPKGGAVSEGIPSLGGEHIDNSGGFKIEIDKLKYVPMEFYKEMKTGVIRTHDILVVKDGATTGKVAYVDDAFLLDEACINEHIFLIRTAIELESKYLFYYLRSSLGQRNIMNDFRGATVGGISKEFIKFDMLLPPLETQKKIVQVLEKAESVIEKRKESIKLLDELVKSRFIEMFGDPVLNPKNWNVKRIIDVCDCMVPGRDKPKSFTGNTPWITIDDLEVNSVTYKSKSNLALTDDEINEVKRKKIPKNSVLMSCVGNLGICSIAGQEMIINQQLHSFQCKNINNFFLMHYLGFRKNYMISQASSTTVSYMNKTACNSIPVYLPPIELQNQFANFANKVDKLKFEMESSLKELENNFNSLMQRAFKGELFS